MACVNVGGGVCDKLSGTSPLLDYIENEKPDILGINEHMKTSITHIPNVPGYKFFFVKANLTGGSPSGGILILVKDSLQFRVHKFPKSSRHLIQFF